MKRAQAFEELCLRVNSEKIIKHSLAVEAIMRESAQLLGEDVELWGLAGLMHDVDYERAIEEPAKHGILGAEILDNLGFDSTIVYAVKVHNDCDGTQRRRKLDKVLYSASVLSEAIIRDAEVLHSGDLQGMTAEIVLKKIEENGFAEVVNCDQIKVCEEFGISLKQFIEISLRALMKFSVELGE